jgi:hypothetical protein
MRSRLLVITGFLEVAIGAVACLFGAVTPGVLLAVGGELSIWRGADSLT